MPLGQRRDAEDCVVPQVSAFFFIEHFYRALLLRSNTTSSTDTKYLVDNNVLPVHVCMYVCSCPSSGAGAQYITCDVQPQRCTRRDNIMLSLDVMVPEVFSDMTSG